MATSSAPYLGYYVSTGTPSTGSYLTYSQPGSYIIDEGTSANVQVALQDTPDTSSTGLYFSDGARLVLGSPFRSVIKISLAPGSHYLTVQSTSADGLSPRSAMLDLFQLPAPVGVGITADNTSTEFANLLGSGYVMRFINPANTVQLVDGVISTDTGGKEANLARLYQGLLGRTYDATGLGVYDVQLAGGRSLADVAIQIMAGAEYATTHGTQTDAQFVASLYAGFFNRGASPQDTSAYQAQLAAGVSRGAVAAAFASSGEATAKSPLPNGVVFARDGIGTLVNQVYQAGLNRTADLGGATTYKAFLASGGSAQGFAAAITGSAEFAAAHGTESNQNYVVDLYRSSLGRSADAAGLQDYTQRLNAGTLSRADVLLAISTSAEAMTRLPTSL